MPSVPNVRMYRYLQKKQTELHWRGRCWSHTAEVQLVKRKKESPDVISAGIATKLTFSSFPC